MSAGAMGVSKSESYNWFNGDLKDMVKEGTEKDGLRVFLTITLIVGMIACIAYIVVFFINKQMNVILIAGAALMLISVILSMIITGDLNDKVSDSGSFFGVSASCSSTFAVYLMLILALFNGAAGAYGYKLEQDAK